MRRIITNIICVEVTGNTIQDMEDLDEKMHIHIMESERDGYEILDIKILSSHAVLLMETEP